MSYQSVIRELGLKMIAANPMEFVNVARKGIPKKTIDAIAKKLDVPVSDLARYLHVSERTLQRYEPDRILSPELSDHILQITKVYTKTLEVFEDRKSAAYWLKQPSIAFGNIPPIEFLDTFAGIEMIFDELSRIEYGVSS